MKTIRSRTVVVIRYGEVLIKRTKVESRTIDRKTRKTMKMHRELLPRADVDRLHTPRKNSGRGMVSVEHYA